MRIFFRTSKLAKECNDYRLLVQHRGHRRAALIHAVLDDLKAANTLEDARALPGHHLHELHGDRRGQISANLDHPYRLIFIPHESCPRKPDGGVDWKAVDAITVLGVEDTHG